MGCVLRRIHAPVFRPDTSTNRAAKAVAGYTLYLFKLLLFVSLPIHLISQGDSTQIACGVLVLIGLTLYFLQKGGTDSFTLICDLVVILFVFLALFPNHLITIPFSSGWWVFVASVLCMMAYYYKTTQDRRARRELLLDTQRRYARAQKQRALNQSWRGGAMSSTTR